MKGMHLVNKSAATDDPSIHGPRQGGRRTDALVLACLLVLVLAVYGRILTHGFIFNWDDAQYVTENEAIRGVSWAHLVTIFSSGYVGNYAPVQMLSYLLDYQLWGLRPAGFLFTNILIHLANGVLLYWLMLRWYGSRFAAVTAAALFLVHPVQVETVAWVSQRKNLLALLFFLLAWEGYRRYREAADGTGRNAYLASLTAFVAALLAKSVAVIFPLVLLLYDRSFYRNDRRLQLKDKLPYLLAAAGVAGLTLSLQRTELGGGRAEYHGGSPLATFLTMLTVFCRYLGMLVWPSGLSAIYAPPIHATFDATVAAAALLLLAVGVGGWLLFRHERRIGFWVPFFFIGLLPVAQIVPLVTLMNDRYLYFPVVGFAALCGIGAGWLQQRQPQGWVTFLVGLPLLVLAVTSFQRAAVWREPLGLWRDAVAKEPQASYAWSSLAEVYFRELRVKDAIEAYEKSLTLNPQNRMAISALGPIYTETGDLERGERILRQYVAMRPYDVKGWAYLGNNLARRGAFAEAEKMYRTALTLKPDSKRVLFMLGSFYGDQNRFPEAREQFLQAEQLWPDDPDVAYRLACLEARSGQRSVALQWLERALQRGYRDYNALAADEELSPLWNEARFTMLLRQYFPEQYP
jgi:Tfp pilus assembly protein PilF